MIIQRTKKSIDELCEAIKKGYVPTKEDLALFDFCNDILGKFILKNHLEMTRHIIEDLFHIDAKRLRNASTHLEPEHITQKEMINDACFFTEHDDMVIFEIQKSKNSKLIRTRAQSYGYFHVNEQLKIKTDYKLNPTYLCVLLNDGKDYPTLIEDGDYMFDGDPSSSLVHCKIVHLPVINRIVKEKGIDGLNTSESIFYVLCNGIDSDILKVGGKVVQKMSEYRDYWLSTTFSQHLAAFSQTLADWEKRCFETEKAEFKKDKVEFEQDKIEFEQDKIEFKKAQQQLKSDQILQQEKEKRLNHQLSEIESILKSNLLSNDEKIQLLNQYAR